MGVVVELDGGKGYVSQLVAGVDGDVVELKGLPVDGGGAQVPCARVLDYVTLGRTRNTQSTGQILYRVRSVVEQKLLLLPSACSSGQGPGDLVNGGQVMLLNFPPACQRLPVFGEAAEVFHFLRLSCKFK
jgi:hypothetical protein